MIKFDNLIFYDMDLNEVIDKTYFSWYMFKNKKAMPVINLTTEQSDKEKNVKKKYKYYEVVNIRVKEDKKIFDLRRVDY